MFVKKKEHILYLFQEGKPEIDRKLNQLNNGIPGSSCGL